MMRNLGVDVSTLVSTTDWSCLKSSGYSFAVPRGYRSSGSVDPNVCSNLKNAQSAGIAYRDVYLFPCPTCSSSAASQMNQLVSYLKTNCATAWSGRVWLDIEGSQYWTGSYTNNKNWYQALVTSCSTYGVKCGVYASQSQWQAIFGSTSYCYGSNLPLWVMHIKLCYFHFIKNVYV
jgi:GH25 family lysozyme M1 (1,4-beta-N-acetylmuramidase)